MSERVPVDRIKAGETSAGWVVLCLEDGSPVLATHRLFEDKELAVAHAQGLSHQRLPIVFQVRRPN